MSYQINGIGERVVGTAGKRMGDAVQATRRVAAVQGTFQRAGTLPAVSQWRCTACGHTNLGRATVCGNPACGEERDMRTAEPKEVA